MFASRAIRPATALLGGLISLALPLAAAAQVVHHVDAVAAGANDGTDWQNAFVDLQDALAAAGPGDEIWVAAGRYVPDRQTGDRAVAFQLLDNVALYGGFAGWETALDERDPAANATVLSGDLADNDGPGTANNDENSYHVVTAGETDSTAVLDGFTITGGNADAELAPDRYGAGLYNEAGSPTVANCTFAGNRADYGGAVYNRYPSTPIFVNCMFNGNSATSAGAMRNASSSPVLINCTFAGNSARLFGGAMANGPEVTPVLTNCTFASNTAFTGAGIYNGRDAGPILTNCILWGNVGLNGTDEPAQIDGGTPQVAYSCVQGWTGAWGGIDNIDADPLFVRGPDPGPDGNWDGIDDDYGDLRLACTSPCLDAGTNTTDPPLPDTDLGGNPRIIDGTVDMGAYEGPNQVAMVVGVPVIIPEGTSGAFGVTLACDPGSPVSVTIEHQVGDADINLDSAATLTFEATNFWIPQLAVLSAAEDDDRAEGAARFRISATGFGYATVVAHEVENDIGPVVFVDDDAGGARDGDSWVDAVADLQLALPLAKAAPMAVDEIWVAAGTYFPAGPGGERSATFQLRSGLAVYGWFAGTESDPGQRDLSNPANETVLSGDLNGDDVGTGGLDDNVYRVVTGSGADQTALLDGFTIRGGNADGSGDDRHGGGMYNQAGNPSLANCTFRGNRATYGAGMFNEYASPTLADCVFADNSATWRGGGMRNQYGSSPTLTGCTFQANSAQIGAGLYNQSSSNPVLTGCQFVYNNASLRGGGVYNDSGDPVLTNCLFVANRAWLDGGGVCNHAGSATLTNCTFAGNWTESDGGGVYNFAAASPIITNCILWGNRDAGGTDESAQLFAESELPMVTFCCIQGLSQFAGNDNIGDDPLFVRLPEAGLDGEWDGLDDDLGDLHLRCASPCLEAGTADTDSPLPETDLDGNPRIVGGLVDIGAYEGPNQAIIVTGDPVIITEGATGVFTVALACDPGGPVSVSVEYEVGDVDITVASGQLLAFDSTNYWVAQTVVLAAAEDDDQFPGMTRFRITAGGIPHAAIRAGEVENDIPPILLVDDDASGANNGTTWPNALGELRTALAVAAASPGVVDQIWVAQGTYTPAEPGGDRGATLQLVNGVTVYGGFAGWETEPDQRDPALFEHTILSGQLDPPNIGASSYHVVTGSGTDDTAVLDGFTITGGNADGPSADGQDLGGGMYNDAGSPTVRDCTFHGNWAYDGGAVCNRNGSHPALTDCTFIDNLTYQYSYGGGVYNQTQSSPTLTNCRFVSNWAWFGGGMFNEDSSPTLAQCTFEQNVTFYDGGGVYSMDESGPTLTGCTFRDNQAEWGGGLSQTFGSPLLANCTFHGNWADLGGGIISLASDMTLVNCTFRGNSALGYGNYWVGKGGAIYVVEGRLGLANCTFSGNFAKDAGGALYSECSELLAVTNCTLANNSAQAGQAVACDSISHMCPSQNVVFTNCVLFNGGDEVWINDGSYLAITYSDVQGGWPGEGNLAEDPLFVDADGPDDVPGSEDDDLRLLPGSPCIDAGNNAAVPADDADLDGDGDAAELTPLDADGNPRFVDDPATTDTGLPDPPDYLQIVDLGAYEFQAASAQTIIAAASLLDHAGSEMGLELTDNDIEPRLAGARRIEVKLTGPVSSVQASVSCVNQAYGGAIIVTPDGTLVTVEFDPPLPDADCCRITLTGHAEGSFTVRPLAGDVNRNSTVTQADMLLVRPHFGEEADETNYLFDLNGTGLITTTDFAQIKPRLNNSAPACPLAGSPDPPVRQSPER